MRSVSWEVTDGGTAPPGTDDASEKQSGVASARLSVAEFRTLSARLDLLVDRSVYDGDSDATAEILAILKPFAKSMLGRIEDATERESAIGLVQAKVWVTLREGLHRRRDVTLAFVITVMRNEATSIYRSHRRWRVRETPLADEYEVVDHVAHAQIDDVHVRALLDDFLTDAESNGSAYDVKVAQVVIAQYRFGLTVAEACNMLVFTPVEKQRISEKISKQRAKWDSPLRRLAEQVFEAPPQPSSKRRTSSDPKEKS